MSNNNIDRTEQRLMEGIRFEVVERLLLGVFAVAVVGTPISISRSFVTGWLPLYSVHLFLAFVAISAYTVRGRLSFGTRLVVILGLFTAIGIGGLIQLGLLGVGMWWLVIISLILSVLYSPKIGLLAALATTVVVLVIANFFVNGVLTPPVDANVYLSGWASWLTLIIGTSLMPFFVFQSIAALQSTTYELLKEVVSQRDKIRELATYDELTGLLMPHVLDNSLKTLLAIHRRSRQPLAVVLVDLDGFEIVNNTLGHDVGDFVLKELARRYQSVFRLEDAIGRNGGDKFIFVFSSPGDKSDIAELAQRLIDVSIKPIEYFEEHTVAVGVSVGISLFPDDSEDAGTLRKLANNAMGEVKRSGGGDFRFSNTESKNQNTNILNVEARQVSI